MSSIFVILLPSVLGIKLISTLTKKRDYKELILYYFLLVLFSNLFCCSIFALFKNFNENIILYIQEHLKFAVKYSIFSIFINIVLAFVFSFFIKYFKLKLEVSYEKDNKKRN